VYKDIVFNSSNLHADARELSATFSPHDIFGDFAKYFDMMSEDFFNQFYQLLAVK